jgi:hypothetical protein
MKTKVKNKPTWRQGVEWVLANLNFIVFVTALGLVYIFNAHNAERKLRKIEVLKKEVKDAKYNYIKVKNDIMYPTTESELARQLEGEGLKMSKGRSIVLKTDKS